MSSILLLFFILSLVSCQMIPDLHPDHYPFFFRNNLNLLKSCKNAPTCDSLTGSNNDELNVNASCWGFEPDCDLNHRYLTPECPGDSRGWTPNKAEQVRVFADQGDFGYIGERQRELRTYCSPKSPSYSDSWLECTQYLRFCRGRHIVIDFKNLVNIEEPMRYREDVLSEGQIGGYNCDLDSKGLQKEGGHKSPLQSWYEEIEHFTVYPTQPECDVTIKKPTFIMKLDATINMYHHFCDFINLYATLHLNNSFDVDNNVLVWDTFGYRSNFGITWGAFTSNPLMDLKEFKGKKVCFEDIVFPLLPRMVFGMYYNMPLIPGCHKSGLFHAFNRHVLYKLNITQDMDIQHIKQDKDKRVEDSKKVRITLILRNTRYRRILNEDKLISALKKFSKQYIITKVDFNHAMPFAEQLHLTQNTDILIGMHGAGLTHCLFQPDWGVTFELYNCEDEHCYKDLARLRGVKYITWEKEDKLYPEDEGHHPQLGAHKKFTNYAFDPQEFLRLVKIGAKHVRKERAKYYAKRVKQKPSLTEGEQTIEPDVKSEPCSNNNSQKQCKTNDKDKPRDEL